MGYYIQTPSNKGKAEHIVAMHDAILIDKPKSFKEVPIENALICVVDNGPFEAAGFAYNESEFEQFSDPTDPRPKKWVLMDRAKAEELTEFNKRR